jgi:hypothetical protein
MNAGTVNQWISTGANVGVLAGIIFLYAELQQNTELARLQFLDARRETFIQREIPFLGDRAAEVWAKSVTDPKSLSLAELRIMDSYLAIFLNGALRTQEIENAGLSQVGATERYLRENCPYYFGSEFGKAWWQSQELLRPEEFFQLANPIIKEIDPNFTKSVFLRMQSPLVPDDSEEDGD